MYLQSPTFALISIYLLFASVEGHNFVPTYFARQHKNGSYINRASPLYDNEISNKKFINKISRQDAETIKVTVWPDTVANGDIVTVLWEGVQNPQAKDYFGFYCPYYDGVEKHYLDYFYANVAAEWDQGYGHSDVTVYNMRESCVFKLWRLSADQNSYTLAAVSNKVTFKGGPEAPLQGHIALGNAPTEMRVMWVSGQVSKPPVVRYGTSKNLTMKENRYTFRTYTADSMCQEYANGKNFWHPGITYDVLLTNLVPNTRYYYSYGTENQMSTIANFTTALPKGDITPFKFVIYGDMCYYPAPQSYGTASNVRRDVADQNVRFVSHIGDISYAEGYAYIWEQWGALIEPYATLVPYMVGIGNHEYDHTDGGIGRDPSGIDSAAGFRPSWWNGYGDSGGECGVPMYNRYHMPDNGNALFWYSYDYGMVHMITISTEHDFTPNSTQYQWLQNDLSKVDRKKTPWVILGGHRPMYNSMKYASENLVGKYIQEYLEELLYAHKVDVAFWGHIHEYERTCKLFKNKCVSDGIVHIVVGTAGHGLDGTNWSKVPWSLKQIGDWGYSRVTVANATALKLEFVRNRSYKVDDYVWLYK